jgi:benzoate-CoA ligase family protein
MNIDLYEPPEDFNIADYFLEQNHAEGQSERVAIVDDERKWTYAEVRALAHQYGHVLQGLGVRPEERVMIALPDSVDFAGAFFGTLKVGGVVVMVNPSFQSGDIAPLYEYVRPSVVIVHDSVREAFLDAAETASPSPRRILLVGGASTRHAVFEEERSDVDLELETTPTHRDDPAVWLFSGGTTGRPKAVVQTHRAFAYTTECYAKRVLGYSQDDVVLSVPKLYFGYATGCNLLFPFAVGGCSVLFAEKPSPELLFDKIVCHRPTILINVPTMINRMLTHPDASQQDLSCLRFATSAGEALPEPLYNRWKDAFGVELLDGLGTAEMWHVFVTNRPGDVRPGTLGRVVEGFEIRVCDAEDRDVEADEVGRMWVRGGARAIGYWQNMEKTQEAFRGEWFVGGDLVRRDADGYVSYCGRADDVLKVAGRWLVPSEVESCLMEHPAVRESAVVGVVDADGLTKPYAFVLCDESTAGMDEELKNFTLERLDAYKHPRRVIVLGDFPRTHLGKVDRGKLKAMI